jgi:cytochrome b561
MAKWATEESLCEKCPKGSAMQGQGYSRTSVLLHSILAVSIVFLFLSSWWMLALPLPSRELRFREIPFQLHKNIGFTLLAVMALMLYDRFRRRPAPVTGTSMKPWMRKLATADHVLLYLLTASVCVSGYMSSAHTRWDTALWWAITLPRIAAPNEEMNEFYSDIHLWTAWALLAFTAVHISGTLYHAFRNDGIVRRMLRW